MKQIRFMAVLTVILAALAGCAAQADGSATAPGSGSASAAPGGGKCSQPFPGDTSVQACTYPDGLYSISYPEANQYYWHPAAGYFAVAETYYKTSAPGRAAGAWGGRTISVGDACVLDESWTASTTTPPSSCMDSRDGEYRQATGEEQRSVLKFWQVMVKDIPNGGR